MSNAPFEARSFEKIDDNILQCLALIALKKLDDAFERRPEFRPVYEKELHGICLCQGAADHLLHPDPLSGRGIHDFDLWAFYPSLGGKSFWSRRASTADYGPSIFGRSPLDNPRYVDRRVDVLWRTIDIRRGDTDVDSIRNYFRKPRSSSAHELRKKSVVMIWPKPDSGVVIWNPNPRSFEGN